MIKPIIEINNVSKKYILGNRQPYLTLGETIVKGLKNPWSLLPKKIEQNRLNKNEFWALKDINLHIQPGEIVGIIGRNGAGKSTLLKLLTQITYPTIGKIVIRGKVSSLLEVGTGFHPELTGRENIYLNGAILGMKRKEIREKFETIVNFAEIRKFIDTPVKYYSSGMYVRLAFAVAAHLETEILIIDEVLAVGDIAFQKKCLGKIDEITQNSKRTIIFVSHNVASIKQLCSRTLLLEKGKIIQIGDTSSVIENYILKSLKTNKTKSEVKFSNNKDKEFQVTAIRLLNEEGKITQVFDCDKAIVVELDCTSRVAVPGMYGYMNLTNKEGIVVFVSDTCDLLPNKLDLLRPGRYKLKIKIPPRTIGHGDYSLTINFTSSQSFRDFYIDTHSYVCGFHLDDNSTERGNKRDGYLSTLLGWEIKKI